VLLVARRLNFRPRATGNKRRAIKEDRMSLFIEVEVAPAVAADTAAAKQLVEVCPVNIFARAENGALQIVEKNLDECTLCELCLNAVPPGSVKVKKLYGEREVLTRSA
jgi:NAD-dependent dihydropyrimidine dehydrogenase PreA subunit